MYGHYQYANKGIKMTKIQVRLPENLKEKLKNLKINKSEFIRQAISEKLKNSNEDYANIADLERQIYELELKSVILNNHINKLQQLMLLNLRESMKISAILINLVPSNQVDILKKNINEHVNEKMRNIKHSLNFEE